MQSLSATPLAIFLAQSNIEASPAWEFINGCAIQKPMPTLFHSRLQRNLVNYINRHTTSYEAIQELRCIVPPYSPVPDIAVVAIARLTDEDGPFDSAPDWLIEIRSPNQSTLDLQTKILHCLSHSVLRLEKAEPASDPATGHGTQLAWLIDIERQQVWVWQGDNLPIIYAGDDPLPMLGHMPALSVNAAIAMTQQR